MTAAPRLWTCIVCAARWAPGEWAPDAHDREGMACGECGASWRVRTTVLALAQGLRYEPRPIEDWPVDWSRTGVGCSDNVAVSSRLPSRLGYVNTWFDRFPVLDITSPPDVLAGTLEFVFCSDVLEHILPPVARGFDGIHSCLRPGGFAMISVPATDDPDTVEFYPGLTDYRLHTGAGRPSVTWTDHRGTERHDDQPEMHGGEGVTLAFRRFSADAVERHLTRAGLVPEPVVPRPDLGVFEMVNPGVFLARKP